MCVCVCVSYYLEASLCSLQGHSLRFLHNLEPLGAEWYAWISREVFASSSNLSASQQHSNKKQTSQVLGSVVESTVDIESDWVDIVVGSIHPVVVHPVIKNKNTGWVIKSYLFTSIRIQFFVYSYPIFRNEYFYFNYSYIYNFQLDLPVTVHIYFILYYAYLQTRSVHTSSKYSLRISKVTNIQSYEYPIFFVSKYKSKTARSQKYIRKLEPF